MVSIFAAAAAQASAAIDAVFGEPFTFQPMATGVDKNARPAPDPSRAAQTVTAAYADTYARAFSGPARTQGVKAERPGHASSRPQISIAIGALPYAIKSGDQFVRQADGAAFRVAEARNADTPGRLFFDVNLVRPGS